MKISQKCSLLFFLSKKRADRNGYCPIYFRITIDGQRSPDLSLGYKLLPRHWDNKQKKVIGLLTPEAKSINLKLLQTKADYETQFSILVSQHGVVSVDMLINAVRPAPQKETAPLLPPQSPIELHKQIDAIFIRCRLYYKNKKKTDKIKDERLRFAQLTELSKELKAIKEEIEKLVTLTFEVYALIPNENKTVMDAAYEFSINFLRKAMGGTRAFTTCKKWWVTKDKIKQFLPYTYKRNEYPLWEVTRAFPEHFYDYLTLVNSCGHNAAMKIVKNTRQIIERAIVSGWLQSNPLSTFKCTYIDPDREALTIEDLIRLINTDLGDLNIVKDAFLFSCFTGFAYEDAKKLTTDDLFTGIDGKLWVKTGRIKTDVRESVPLLPIALLILTKYEDHPCRTTEGRLVPIYSNQYYNRCLKEIAEKCNLRTDLTTHYARHTFATTITLENDVPLSAVAKMLGLKSVRTAEKYAKASQRKISRNMNKVQQQLFNEQGHLKAIV